MRLVRLAGLLVGLGVAGGIGCSRDVPVGFRAAMIGSVTASCVLVELLLDAGIMVLMVVMCAKFVSVLLIACILGALLQVLN